MLNGVTVVINNATLRMGFAATLVVNVMCFPIFLVAAPYAITLRFSEDMWVTVWQHRGSVLVLVR